MATYFGDVWLVRLLVQRTLAAIYLCAFVGVLKQFKPLLGERGFLPVPIFLKNIRFAKAPSIFYLRYSDRLLDAVAWIGITLSIAALTGVSETGPYWLSLMVWLVLWGLYLLLV